jgi:hypothetical protein
VKDFPGEIERRGFERKRYRTGTYLYMGITIASQATWEGYDDA